jgi:hypothetical protein
MLSPANDCHNKHFNFQTQDADFLSEAEDEACAVQLQYGVIADSKEPPFAFEVLPQILLKSAEKQSDSSQNTAHTPVHHRGQAKAVHKVSVGNMNSRVHENCCDRAAAILRVFETGDSHALSMSRLMREAALADTKKNRAIMNSLVKDGRLLMEGRSRSTRYSLAAK